MVCTTTFFLYRLYIHHSFACLYIIALHVYASMWQSVEVHVRTCIQNILSGFHMSTLRFHLPSIDMHALDIVKFPPAPPLQWKILYKSVSYYNFFPTSSSRVPVPIHPDDRFWHLGIDIVDLGYCKGIRLPYWGWYIFVGAIFTDVPVTSQVVASIMELWEAVRILFKALITGIHPFLILWVLAYCSMRELNNYDNDIFCRLYWYVLFLLLEYYLWSKCW